MSSLSEARKSPGPPPASPTLPSVPRIPQPVQHLHLGISAHGADNLRLAAEHFELAAKLGGGCALGMIMWGLTLRHGWGLRKDVGRGYVWMRKGVERALKEWEVEEPQGKKIRGLQPGRGQEMIKELGGVRRELVLALGEVARGSMHGWGVKEDKKMGFNYFIVGAQLGDAECAQEVAFCYEKGRGVRKDKMEAARWYRQAIKAGMSDVGLAWIWKPKYD
ncbi:hypothetical protein DACRYDRAFT_56647 [Dacryopinax primogenitus]|uniref:HCP-like protein n=1 Tax=Dacryopinax primogenitus (strain DJM 731) TaxID=1858805 RepID=M5G562_DACPD|nr:uncharacterized protein DACRYDRAFT_56647 [Dacryopinax primogenitus]EJT98892.1 hypothetical protein DACRYDRAFT_56647 [Dacryopinax primogenitus]